MGIPAALPLGEGFGACTEKVIITFLIALIVVGSGVGRHVATVGDAIMIHYDKKLEDTTDGEVDMISWQRVF